MTQRSLNPDFQKFRRQIFRFKQVQLTKNDSNPENVFLKI